MASQNLFKFVSVRPPTPEAPDKTCRLINEETGTRFVDEVLARQQEKEESLQVARRAVSSTFMKSGDYFVLSELWHNLRPLKQDFQDLVRGTCSPDPDGEVPDPDGEVPDPDGEVPDPDGETHDLKEVRAKIENALGLQIHDWLDSETFTKAKETLWRSYYANALIPEARPNDRPEVLEWIRVLAALEQLRPALEDAQRPDKESCACVRYLSRARVNIPHRLFAETPSPERVPDNPEDPVRAKTDALRASVKQLNDIRQDLDQLYQSKINKLRLASFSPASGDGEAAQPAPPRAEGEAPSSSHERLTAARRNLNKLHRPKIFKLRVFSDLLRPGEIKSSTRKSKAKSVQPTAEDIGAADVLPPWLLTQDDVGGLPELKAVSDRLGISLAGSTVPQVTEALDKAIAADTAALVALESHVDVMGIGSTMTLIRRTVRSIQPSQGRRAENLEQTMPEAELTEPHEEQVAMEGQEGTT